MDSPDDYDIKPAGPGSQEATGDAPEPLLQGASEYEYVEILNPLSVIFIGQFGVTKPANSPARIGVSQEAPGVSRTEEDVRRNYGLDLRNPDHRGSVNIVNKVEIPSGKTIRLLGNEAQVIVRQLVTEIMQRRGQRLLLSDPFARNKIEKDVIIARGNLKDVLGTQPISVQEQLQEAVKSIGDDDEAFPSQSTSTGTTESSGRGSFNTPAEKAEESSSGQPAPGTGQTYQPDVADKETGRAKAAVK